MSAYIFPERQISLPLSFRPNTRICTKYVTSGNVIPAPAPPADLVFPTGGQFYPPTRYMNAIDDESLLRRLDRPLGTPDNAQYVPPTNSDMYTYSKISLPRKQQFDISELELSKVLLRDEVGSYSCRRPIDEKNAAMSKSHFFNYPTKTAKYMK
jgi:hypothetical protein